MEIIESVAWITLGFLPMLGSMELAWILSRKKRPKKAVRGTGVRPWHATKVVLKH
jgi:hypothetical protein